MAKTRDYKAEYAARIQRGIERGLSRSQSRGHSRRTETPVSKLPESVRRFRPIGGVRTLPPQQRSPVEAPTGGRYSLVDYKAVPVGGGKTVIYVTYGMNSRTKLTPEQALSIAQNIIDAEGGKYRTCRVTMKGRRSRSRDNKTSYVTGITASTGGNAATSNYTPIANSFKYVKGVQVTFKEVRDNAPRAKANAR